VLPLGRSGTWYRALRTPDELMTGAAYRSGYQPNTIPEAWGSRLCYR